MLVGPEGTHERTRKRQTLGTIEQQLATWRNEYFPYVEARYILTLHSHDPERFDEDILTLANGEKRFVLNTEELAALKEEAEAADNRVRATLGLDPDINISVFSHTVLDLSGPRIGETALARRHPDTMYQFLRAVQALSDLTGVSYEVWSNSYGTTTTTINNSIDILSLLRENFEEEIKLQPLYRANPHLTDSFKQRLTPDALEREYGLPY